MPTFVLALIGIIIAQAYESERRTDVREMAAAQDTSEANAPLRITVYEQPGCGHCEDFRTYYLSRLRSDFGHSVDVSLLHYTEASWVRATPTVVIEGISGPAMVGLSMPYEDLREVIVTRLSARRL